MVRQLSDTISERSFLQVDKIVTRSETGIKIEFQLFFDVLNLIVYMFHVVFKYL